MPRSSPVPSGRFSTALTLILFVFMAGAMALGYGPMIRRITHERRPPMNLVIEWPPMRGSGGERDGATWLSEPYQHEVLGVVRTALTDDPYDHAALARAADALLSTGWVRRVESIRREVGGIVRVKAEWRTPAAAVRSGGQDHLVSTEGERLPVAYRPGQSGFRVITNVSCPPPAQAGERWLGGDVQAALALIGQLQRSPAAYAQVTGIDCERYARSRRLAAITDRGTTVVWGIPPGESRVGEPSTASKMARLATLLNDPAYGRRIDANQPLVDLTSPSGILIDASARPGGSPTGSNGEAPDEASDRTGERGAIASDLRKRVPAAGEE